MNRSALSDSDKSKPALIQKHKEHVSKIETDLPVSKYGNKLSPEYKMPFT